MPNPTLYDNFNQVRQYIDQNQVDLSSYVSKSELEGMSYATTSYVVDYVVEHGGGGSTTIDENIIPKETSTYTLGDASYLYSATYTGSLYLHPNNGWINVSNWQTKFRIDNSDKYYLTSNRFYPNVNGACHLGLSTNKWGDTYTANLYADNAYLQNTSYSSSILPKETTTYTLGDSSHIYSNTYSRGVYLGTGVRMYSESSASSSDMAIDFGGVSYFYFNNNRFAPNGADNNNKIDLGSGDRRWRNVYSYNYNFGFNTKIHSSTNYNIIFTLNSNTRYQLDTLSFVHYDNSTSSSLGTSSKQWGYTYTKNLYTNTAYLQDTSYSSSIIPKENLTYQLGDRTHNYKATYTSSLKSNDSGITIQINDNNKYYISSSAIRPTTTNSVNLGTNDYPWAYTYTNRVNFGTNKVYIYNNGDTQMKFGVNNADRFRIDYNSFVPSISGAVTQLGTSNTPFTNTYTSNLYSPSLVLSYSYNSIDNASNTQINFKVNQWNRMKLTNTALMPSTNNGIKLGDPGAQWSSTYVRDLYLNGTNIINKINGMFSYDSTTGTLTITTLS